VSGTEAKATHPPTPPKEGSLVRHFLRLQPKHPRPNALRGVPHSGRGQGWVYFAIAD